MTAYEVTVTIEPDRAREFEIYMRGRHIRDVLATGLFSHASFESTGPGVYRTRYIANSRDALDLYLTEHAHRLRDDFGKHVRGNVSVERAVWEVIEAFA